METKAAITSSFSVQSEACTSLGSPFTGRFCALFAERLDWHSPLGQYLSEWKGDPAPYADNVPLRLAGALHVLVLLGQAAGLQAVYPPNHQDVSDEELWIAVIEAIVANEEFIFQRMKSAPQTNEVRRSAMILPAFAMLAKEFGKPFVLSEVGSSCGLNLMFDQLSYRLSDKNWGPQTAPFNLQPDWKGSPPPDLPEFIVSDRRGCDLNPPDISDDYQRTLALSYIWPDQTERLERTRLAMDMAVKTNVLVDKEDAVSWLGKRLEQKFDDHCHVIFHTVVRQYFSAEDKEASANLLEEAGARATNDAPLAWVQMEADGKSPGAGLYLQTWPEGEIRELARADFHGRWIDWKD